MDRGGHSSPAGGRGGRGTYAAAAVSAAAAGGGTSPGSPGPTANTLLAVLQSAAGSPVHARSSPAYPYRTGTRYTGRCEFWHGRGGWGRLAVDEVGGKVFVHNTALVEPSGAAGGRRRRRRALSRGALVDFEIVHNDKGPMAADVGAR
jgi:cold shock CspA family protein